MAAQRRIQKELADLYNDPQPGFSVDAKEDNIFKWTAKLHGPKSTPYAGGTFNLDVEFPVEYPFKPPKFKFATRVYHPNIDDEGNICMGLLKTEAWKPSTKVQTVLLSILNLLEEPNPDDALVSSIAEIYNTDRPKFEKTAKEYTRKYAA